MTCPGATPSCGLSTVISSIPAIPGSSWGTSATVPTSSNTSPVAGFFILIFLALFNGDVGPPTPKPINRGAPFVNVGTLAAISPMTARSVLPVRVGSFLSNRHAVCFAFVMIAISVPALSLISCKLTIGLPSGPGVVGQ